MAPPPPPPARAALLGAGRRRTIASVGAWALLVCMHTACFVVTDDGRSPPEVDTLPNDPAVAQGTLALGWKVDGARDPARCGADVVALRVVTESNAFVATEEAPCDAFVVRALLSPGRYRALAELRDPTGHALGPSATTAPFTIVGREELALSIDLVRRAEEE